MANVIDAIQWSQVPPVEETTKEHREALQQELDRVLRTAKASADYATIRADDPEVAACEKAIKDMLKREQDIQMVSNRRVALSGDLCNLFQSLA